MNPRVAYAAIPLLLAGVPVARADILLFEDFSAATPYVYGGTIPNTAFRVSNGKYVEIHGMLNQTSGTYGTCLQDPAGNCLDLTWYGAVASTKLFDLVAGTTYTISYDAVLRDYTAGETGVTTYLVGLGNFSSLQSTAAVQSYSLSYTPTSNETGVALTFRTASDANFRRAALLDNITVSSGATAVPEPASGALVATGIAMLGVCLRRRSGTRGGPAGGTRRAGR